MSETQATETTNGHAEPFAPPLQRITMTPTIGKLLTALAVAQGEFGHIPKNRNVQVRMKTGGTYDFDYATLDQVLAATRPALSKNGIAFVQVVTGGGDSPWRITTLLALGEERIESVVQLPGGFDGPQELGSYITYLRRYTAVALLGVVADEDDDGNAAEGNEAQKRDREPPRDFRKDPPRNTPAGKEAQEGRNGPKGSAPAPSAQPTGAAGATTTPPADPRIDRIKRIMKNDLKWTEQGAKGWMEKRFGVDHTSKLKDAKVKGDPIGTAEILLIARTVSDEAYNGKVAEMVAAELCLGEAAAA